MARKRALREELSADGWLIVLAFEWEAIGLGPPQEMYKAFLFAKSVGCVEPIDEVWLVRPLGEDREVFCFFAPENLQASVNPLNLMFERRHDRYWESVMVAEGGWDLALRA